MSSDDCIFCRILRGEIPSQVVGESERCVAFRDVAPAAPVHILVVPRTHIPSVDATPDGGVLGELLLLAASVARDQGVAGGGYRLVINTNSDGGQTVFHLHVHLLGGRPMSWPPG